MARFRVGNAAGNPWTGVSPNKTPSDLTGWEADFNASVVDLIDVGDFNTGIYPWLNPMTFGATGLGTVGNDDLAAFQAMVDSVATDGRAVVWVPPGIYRLSGPIVVADKTIMWLGSGMGITTFRCEVSGFDIDVSGIAGTRKQPLVIQDMSILSVATVTAGTTPSTYAIKYRGKSALGVNDLSGLITRLSIRGETTSAQAFGICLDLADCEYMTVRDIAAVGHVGTHAASSDPTSTTSHFIYLGRTGTGMRISGCEVTNVGTALEIYQGVTEGIYVTDNVFVKVHNGVVVDQATATDNLGSMQIHRNHIAAFKYGVRIFGVNGVYVGAGQSMISKNYFLTREDALPTVEDYVAIDHLGQHSNITGNTVLNIQNMNLTYKGIVVRSSGAAAGDNVIVSGNSLTNMLDGCIELDAGTEDVLVTGNLLNGAGNSITDNGTVGALANKVNGNLGTTDNKPRGLRLSKSGGQNISASNLTTAGTAITWDTEAYDYEDRFDSGSSTTDVTIPANTWWRASLTVSWATHIGVAVNGGSGDHAIALLEGAAVVAAVTEQSPVPINLDTAGRGVSQTVATDWAKRGGTNGVLTAVAWHDTDGTTGVGPYPLAIQQLSRTSLTVEFM